LRKYLRGAEGSSKTISGDIFVELYFLEFLVRKLVWFPDASVCDYVVAPNVIVQSVMSLFSGGNIKDVVVVYQSTFEFVRQSNSSKVFFLIIVLNYCAWDPTFVEGEFILKGMLCCRLNSGEEDRRFV
jgi:hypothetical protein